MTILFTGTKNVYLYFAVGLFLNKKTRIIDVLGVIFYPLANEVARGYSNATVRPSVLPSVRPSVRPSFRPSVLL